MRAYIAAGEGLPSGPRRSATRWWSTSSLSPAERRPARTIFQAAALPFGGQVKVMGVAIKDAAA